MPEPESATPPSITAASSDRDTTPARRHGRRLFEVVHALTDTGRCT
ncbi:hypothetical protein NRF20_38035 [Streptomyces sp. R-74717]